MSGSNLSLQQTDCSGCGSHWNYLDPLSEPQAGTLHLLRCCIKVLCFPLTQRGSDWPDFSLCSKLHPDALMFSCACVTASLHGSWTKHISSCPLYVPSLLTHTRRGFACPPQIVPSAARIPFQVFVDSRDTVENATVPVLTTLASSHE